MRAEQVLSSALLDILFENRNKGYGAYNLRKFYNNRLVKALAVMMLLAALMFLFIRMSVKENVQRVPVVPDIEITRVFELPPPAPVEPPKPKAVPTKPAAPVASYAYVDNINITKEEADVAPLVNNLEDVAIAAVTQAGIPGVVQKVQAPVVVEAPAKEGAPGSAFIPDPSVPRNSADIMPLYPGGMDALRKFLQKNLQNPEEIAPGEEVLVKIKFVVGYNGKLQGFEVVKDGGKAFNQEVVRVLRKMPEWIPGKSNGQNVAVYYTIPVRFMVTD